MSKQTYGTVLPEQLKLQCHGDLLHQAHGISRRNDYAGTCTHAASPPARTSVSDRYPLEATAAASGLEWNRTRVVR